MRRRRAPKRGQARGTSRTLFSFPSCATTPAAAAPPRPWLGTDGHTLPPPLASAFASARQVTHTDVFAENQGSVNPLLRQAVRKLLQRAEVADWQQQQVSAHINPGFFGPGERGCVWRGSQATSRWVHDVGGGAVLGPQLPHPCRHTLRLPASTPVLTAQPLVRTPSCRPPHSLPTPAAPSSHRTLIPPPPALPAPLAPQATHMPTPCMPARAAGWRRRPRSRPAERWPGLHGRTRAGGLDAPRGHAAAGRLRHRGGVCGRRHKPRRGQGGEGRGEGGRGRGPGPETFPDAHSSSHSRLPCRFLAAAAGSSPPPSPAAPYPLLVRVCMPFRTSPRSPPHPARPASSMTRWLGPPSHACCWAARRCWRHATCACSWRRALRPSWA